MKLRLSDVLGSAAVLGSVLAVSLTAGTAQAAQAPSDTCEWDAYFGYWQCQSSDKDQPRYYEKYDEGENCTKIYYHPPVDSRASGFCEELLKPPVPPVD